MTNITPVGNLVFIKPLVEELESKGGLIIPDNVTKKSNKGTVIAVGPKVLEVKVGDTIVYVGYPETEIKRDGEVIKILSEDVIQGVIE